MDFGKDVEDDDTIVLYINDKNVELQCTYILDFG